MLDIKFIRDNLEKVKQGIKNKNSDPGLLDKLIALDDARRKLLIEVEAMRSRRNEITKKLQKGRDDDLIEAGKQLKEQLGTKETELANTERDWTAIMYQIPNLPLEHVPVGKDESANKVLRKEGTPPKFTFKPKDHLELGEALGIIDVARAAKVSGSRFAYLKNEAVLMEFALVQFAMGRLMRKGFMPILPPAMIKQNITQGLGYWQGGGNENYYLVENLEKDEPGKEEKNHLYLVGTAEHSVVPLHKDETIPVAEFPKKYVAFSPSFRKEAGTYGKDTRGILRVHQFDKVEMVAYTTPEQDEAVRKQMLEVVEGMLKELELAYQIVQLSTGDMSFPAAETIDIETWIPSQEKYRETHSISTTTNFQARRLNIWYQAADDRRHAHILNGTAFAIGRMIVALLENNQLEDGSIAIPKALQPYLGFEQITKK